MVQHDELQLLRGLPYKINDKISVCQPTLDEIYNYGEAKYFSLVSNLVAIPSDLKSVLWDSGIDYEEISDFQLFTMLTRGLTTNDTLILFGENINLSSLGMFVDNENGEVFLGEVENKEFKEDGVKIDVHIYVLITDYLRSMHGFIKKIEHAGNESTKKIMIDLDREDRKINQNKEYESMLAPLIMALINCPEFKYNLKDVWELPISVFLNSVKQIQKYKNANYLIQGIYSGNVDQKKINKKDLNWI